MNKNRVLFLDFDGVLNSHAFLTSNTIKTPYDSELDPEKMSLLNLWCEQNNILVVISSSWIDTLSLEQIKELFKDYEHIKIIGTISKDFPKAIAIEKHITLNKLSNFVIIDDDSLFDLKDPLNKRQVKTSFYTGLTSKHLEEALELLK